MTLVLGIRAIVAVVGVLVYALSANPKLAEIGRLSFFAGLLALLFHLR